MFTTVLLIPVETPSLEIIALHHLHLGAARLVLRILDSAQRNLMLTDCKNVGLI